MRALAPLDGLARLTIALGLLATCACGPTVDLTKALQVTDVATGWHDAGVTDGKTKLVPSIVFKLKNNSDQSLGSLQVNVIFRRVTEPDEWGSGWVKVVGSEGLAPGATTQALTVSSKLGYTGTDSRAELLKHRSFVDAKVELFAKYASTQWTRVAEFPVTRQLEAR